MTNIELSNLFQRNFSFFRSQVSLGMKKLKKGGTPNASMAAKYVLNNWYSGKIRFFTQTPDQDQPRPDHVTPEVVAEHTKEFWLVFYWDYLQYSNCFC
jgi:hypothetical protein